MGRHSQDRPKAEEITDEQIDIFIKEFAKRAQKLRKDKGFRADHFAYEINLSRSALSRIDKGETDLLFSNVLRIIFGLGTDLPEFFAEGFTPIRKPIEPRSKH